MIEKLTTGKTSDDLIHWTSHPTREELIDKINELVIHINKLEQEFQSLAKYINIPNR